MRFLNDGGSGLEYVESEDFCASMINLLGVE